MYAQHWGLLENPFQSTFDYRWFYEGPTHEEALARLLFLVEQRRRCGVLTGAAGTGKSMLLSVLKRAVRLAQGEVVEIDLVGKNSDDLLWDIASQLRLGPQPGECSLTTWRKIEDALLGNSLAQAQTVLLFDHLERADRDCLQAITRLMHLNFRSAPWTTIITATRKENLSDCREFFQDVLDLQIDIPVLSRDESREYMIAHMKSAGRRESLFTDSALDRIFEYSGGVPREINRLCDLSLLNAMAANASLVSEDFVTAMADANRAEPIATSATGSRF